MMSRGESKNKNYGPKKLSVTRSRSESEIEKKDNRIRNGDKIGKD